MILRITHAICACTFMLGSWSAHAGASVDVRSFASASPSSGQRSSSISLRHIEQTFRTPNDVMRGLNSLTRQLHAVKDRRALFSGVYAMAFYSGVTDLQSGGYHDPKWTRALMISHANAYRRMILSELRSDRSRISRAWRYALEFTERSRKWPQGFAGRSSADNPKHRWSADLDLVYSTHAHIMGDLVHALLQTPTEFGSRRLQADYERITESLHSAMPQIWAYYKSHPGSTSVSEKLSQKIIGGWIANLRTDAWEAAATMSEMEPRKRAKALGRLDAHVARRSANKGILLPILNHKH